MKSMRIRLYFGFGIVVFLYSIVSIFIILTLDKIAGVSDKVSDQYLPGMNYLTDATLDIMNYRLLEIESMSETDKTVLNEINKSMNTHSEKVDDNIDKYINASGSNKNIQKINDIENEWGQYVRFSQTLFNIDKTAKTEKEMNEMKNNSKEMYDTVYVDMSTFSMSSHDELLKANTESSKVFGSFRMILIILLLMVVSFSAWLCISLVRSITDPIKKLVMVADSLAVGDINVEMNYSRKDEFGDLAKSLGVVIQNIKKQALLVERMASGDLTVDIEVRSGNDILNISLESLLKKYRETLGHITSAFEQVAVGSKKVLDSSIALSEGAAEQSGAIEELTASIEEISIQSSLNSQNAGQADKLVEQAKEYAEKGNDQMKLMLISMLQINEASTNISKIIKVIEDIAFQTNILALNAAVEAARAGQNGKGFAVVADEVRTLAARSSDAAKDTTELIESSMNKVEEGTRIAQSTAQSLNGIVEEITRVAELAGNIKVASNEQEIGVSQIKQGIMQVMNVVKANAANSAESAEASRQLSSQAMILKEAVSKYRIKADFEDYNSRNDEIIKMLDDINEKSQIFRKIKDSNYIDRGRQNIHIDLSDDEFGKY